MSHVQFSSIQFKFAQCYTWMMKKIVKHKKYAKYILHSICIDRVSQKYFNTVLFVYFFTLKLCMIPFYPC